MTRRFAALAAALTIGLSVPATSALAFYERPVNRSGWAVPHDPRGYSPVYGSHGWCAPSSAAEGNANQQTRPVKQYGQTSGGSRC